MNGRGADVELSAQSEWSEDFSPWHPRLNTLPQQGTVL